MSTTDFGSSATDPRQVRQLLVRLDASVPPDEIGADGADLDIFAEVLARHPDLTIRQCFPRFVRRLRVRHKGHVPAPRGQPERRLDLFFRVTVPDPRMDLNRLLAEIRAENGISDVRHIIPASSKPPAADCSVSDLQGYHRRSIHHGIDTCYAWNVTSDPPGLPSGGGAGERVVVCVVDFDFGTGHVNGAEVTTTLGTPTGGNNNYERHGCMALGVLGSPGNGDEELRGICPEATLCFSYVEEETSGHPLSERADEAIDRALELLDETMRTGLGAVLVIEAQLDTLSSVEVIPHGGGPEMLPAEANVQVYSALATAASEGVTVVEAAGNGDKEFVKIVDGDTEYWDPNPADGTSSGAIMVGAGHATTHECVSQGNWGPRVDCQGWGHNVFAPAVPSVTGDVSFGDAGSYDPNFNGTSSATAIVGGVVAVLQGAFHAVNGSFLDPAEIREMLRDPNLGHPDPLDEIGPLPDLYRLLCTSLGICTDLFVRDDDEDTGRRPLGATTLPPEPIFSFASPDIFVQPTEMGVGGDFEAGAAHSARSHPRVSGGENHVYARVMNRGRGADSGRLSIFWSEPSSFLHPRWLKIAAEPGSFPCIRPGSESIVHVPWDAPFGDAGEHCALVAVVEPSRGGVVHLDAAMTTAEYRDLLVSRNDVGIRNVHVGHVEGGDVSFRYHLRGQPEGPATFRLNFTTDVPADALELKPDTTVTFVRGDRELRLTSERVTSLDLGDAEVDVELAMNAEIIFDLVVTLPRTAPPGQYTLTIDQYLGALQLGRCTYVIVVPSVT